MAGIGDIGGVRGPVIAGLRRAASGAAELLWPTRCFGCDVPGTLLCASCAARLPAIEQRQACPRCGAPFGSLVCTECTDCLLRNDDDGGEGFDAPGPLDALRSLDGVCCFGVHAWPLDRVVRGYKDGGERRAATILGELLLRALEDRSGFGAPWDAVTFVPCTREAYARRGGDHMEAVARHVAQRLGVPVADVLVRDAARDQRGLTRLQRSANARRSFACARLPAGRRLLLLDDVLTTGATLGAAASALRAAGASWVCGATVTRAW